MGQLEGSCTGGEEWIAIDQRTSGIQKQATNGHTQVIIDVAIHL